MSYNEIDFLGANLLYLAGETQKSAEIYGTLAGQGEELMSRGLVLNNLGVSLTKALFEKSINSKDISNFAGEIEKIARLFEDSVLDLEGTILPAYD